MAATDFWSMGALTRAHLLAEATGGTLSMLEHWIPAGVSPPTHVHRNEDQTVYVLEGEITARLNVGETKTDDVATGGAAFLPRQVPHTFLTGPDGVKLLEINTPGGFEQFHIDLGAPATEARIPGPTEGVADIDQMMATLEAYDAEIVAPPMDQHRNPKPMAPQQKGTAMTTTENPTGKKFWFDGFLMEVLVSAVDTDGSLSVCEQTHRGGYGTPVHLHEREDQTLYVLEGQITAWIDPNGETTEHVVEAGQSVFCPRGIAHAFRVDADGTRLLEINTPGGFEGFHIAAGTEATHDGLPEPSPPDVERLIRHADDYACHIQGPPVETN